MIALSKRENIFYIERTRVCVLDGTVVFYSKNSEIFSIPDKNTMLILMGNGTSITNAAVNALADSNVIVCFTNSGGSPLIMSSESYFGEMKYSQKWFEIFMDDKKRLNAAKIFSLTRASLVYESPFIIEEFGRIPELLKKEFEENIDKSDTINSLMGHEGRWSKRLYSHMSQGVKFKRTPGKGDDLPNKRLDHGNYIAYGFAAVAIKALNIPYSLPVMHGRTNRGALIFDVADIVKDAVILPTAFENKPKFRDEIISRFKKGRCNYVEYMIETMKTTIDTLI